MRRRGGEHRLLPGAGQLPTGRHQQGASQRQEFDQPAASSCDDNDSYYYGKNDSNYSKYGNYDDASHPNQKKKDSDNTRFS